MTYEDGLERQDCDGPDCKLRITVDKPPIVLEVEHNQYNPVPNINSSGGSFCSEGCMQDWLDDNRR
ncbi:hypothetical protein LCGC14_1119920 [marine sediment metagenome]|uniref:Uncharacterized protein n=1 Tax=marine sediment metagenome TaxID=412755 RepID=A0A0F9MS11_9ZZZZ